MISGWVLYWAIGGVLILFIINKDLLRFVDDAAAQFKNIALTEERKFWLLYFSLLLAALFWPLMFVPKVRL